MTYTRREQFLPFTRPMVGAEEIAEIIDSIESGWITTGPKAARFEDALCEYNGVAHCLAMNSATTAQEITMQLLGLKPGDDASLLVSTLHGQANATDATVLHTYNTGNAGLEDKALFLPLAMAQSLYDATDRADRLTILLPDIAQTGAARAALASACAANGLDVEISTWQEQSAFYRQVKGMFDMIFSFILAIVLTIVVMSVTNAMSMSVVERTREIGTLRAIGLRRAGVVRLFVAEALLLVGIGCGFGLLLTLLARLGVNALHFSYTPPNGSGKVMLLVGLDAGKMLFTGFALGLLGLVAAIFPARRAARQPVTESLAHI